MSELLKTICELQDAREEIGVLNDELTELNDEYHRMNNMRIAQIDEIKALKRENEQLKVSACQSDGTTIDVIDELTAEVNKLRNIINNI